MRRLLFTILTAAIVMAMSGTAFAHPRSALQATLPTDVTFAATDNIDYLGRFPEHATTAGGMRLGDVYYVSDGKGVYTYDVTDPANPSLLGLLPHPQTGAGLALAQEDPNTDGRVLVLEGSQPLSGDTAHFTVVDVSDPTNLSVISELPGVSDHTWTCVSGQLDTGEQAGCAYVFGRDGDIIDITDPTAPVNLPFTWRQIVGYGNRSNSPYTHDLTEVRPGVVVSAGSTMFIMDTSSLAEGNPAGIREITRVDQAVHGHAFASLGYHSVEWSTDEDGGLDNFMVAGTEIAPSNAGSDCSGDESVIESFDVSTVAAAHAEWEAGTISFEELKARSQVTLIDSFQRAGRGAYIDGQAPGHVLYCAHWMELHPDFDNGGMVATSYYDRGTRFVKVQEDGTFGEEAGWIVPFQGYSGSVQWVTEDVLYIHDYTRGLEVIRLNSDEATGTYRSALSPMHLTSNFSPPAPIHTENLPQAALLLLGFAMVTVQVRRSRVEA